MLKEEAEKNFNLFYIENLDKTIRYFIYKGAPENDAEELASISLLGLWNFWTTKYDTGENIPLEEWPRLFNWIKSCRLKDYWSHINTKKIKNIKSISELDNEYEFNETFISEDKTTIQCDNTDEPLSHWSIRVVLNSKQASLQNTTIIFYTPSFNKLKDALKNKFSFTEKYYNKYKRTSCYLTYKDKDKISPNENITQENLKEMNETFSKIINTLSDKLKINDPIGQEALKIILLSRQPWTDLAMRLGYKSKKETFRTIETTKNTKKYKNRPYLHWFRDFIGYKIKTIRLKKFIFHETKKYPELEVSKEYVEKFYNIGKLNSESLKKQRKGRSNRPGLKQKINLYETIIKDEIPKIINS